MRSKSLLTWSRLIRGALMSNVCRVGYLHPATEPPQERRWRHALHRTFRLADLWHTLRDFIRPDFKALQSVWAEGGGDGNIGRVAALRDEHSSNPGHVVPRIECVPSAT
jgi:hypothetical protein